ncbi:MAG TPA: alpha/beta hydrolase, partial [Steroidobacteraceae bacterium]|nr:alpha/beta hydrolase [Steroidobacteraceae bacterium]
NIKTELEQLLSPLQHNSIAIALPEPRSGIDTKIDFTYMHLAAALRLYSYSDFTAAALPYLIHEAAQGRVSSIAAQAMIIARDLNKELANGMHNAVVCTEDVTFITTETLNDTAIDRSYLRRYFVETLQAMCSVWPRGVLDADFHAPLTSDVPALLLSGANDPVTPMSYGELAVRGFKNGKHIVTPGKGHGQLNNVCVAHVMTSFIEQGSSADLKTQCVTKQNAAPFLLNASSPGR